jgi:hypothetical protein
MEVAALVARIFLTSGSATSCRQERAQPSSDADLFKPSV